jgi:metal-responsive CopG/Arc/MetJ family transcriptional regulator
MKILTISVDEETLEYLNSGSKKANTSRSAFIQHIIKSYQDGQNVNKNLIKTNNNAINLERQVSKLERQLGWLQGEYSKLSDAVIQKALPRKSVSVFSKLKFWGKR